MGIAIVAIIESTYHQNNENSETSESNETSDHLEFVFLQLVNHFKGPISSKSKNVPSIVVVSHIVYRTN